MTIYYGLVFASGDLNNPLLGKVARKPSLQSAFCQLEVLPVGRLNYYFRLFFPIKVVVALSDTAIFQDNIADKKLESLICALQQYPTVQLVAIELESEVIARALQHCGVIKNKNSPSTFGILLINQQQKTIWLSVFKNTQKIFFHLEKLHSAQDQVQIKAQVENLFSLCPPEVVIHRHNCHIIGENQTEQSMVFENLLLYGLSLWHPQKNKPLLMPHYLKKYTRKFALWTVSIKAGLLGMLVVFMLHVGFHGLLTVQQKNMSVFTQKLIHAQHQSQNIQLIKQKILFYQTLKTKNKAIAVKFLDMLNHGVPMGMALQTVYFQLPYDYVITGQVDEKSTVSMLLNTLKKYAVFSNHLASNISANHQALLNVDNNNAYPYQFLIKQNLLNHETNIDA